MWLEILKYNIIANIILYVFCIHVWGRAHKTKNTDPEIMKKYPPFVRIDMHLWDSLWVVPGLLISIPRIFMGAFLLMIYCIQVTIVMCGTKP